MTRILSIAVAVLVVGCAPSDDGVQDDASMADEAVSTDAYPDAVSADPGHYAVELENDAVRVLRISYGPGETSVLHSHPPICSVALTDATWQMTDADGGVTEDSAAFGDVECGDEADVHTPQNAGSEAAEVILVEMKEGATAGTAPASEHPHAATADPDHYTVEYENDVLRMVRVRYGAGETSVMHSHPAHCVVYLRDQPVTFELPSGDVAEAPPGEAGGFMCVDAGAHIPTSTGDGELEVVLIELKGRATAGG